MQNRNAISLFILIGVLIIFNQQAINGQIFTGGNVGANYNNGWFFEVAPIIGYEYYFLRSGVSPVITYSMPDKGAQFYTYGGRIFTEAYSSVGFFGHAEFGGANVPLFTADNKLSGKRLWTMAFPVGAGYEYKIGANAKAQVMILYDLLPDKYSQKQNPEIRGGVVYNF